MARELTEHAAAAKAIRQQLNAAFPTVAFKVRSSSFSGGDVVDVDWTDGPTTDQVNRLVNKYQYGHFDGMIDLYEYSNVRADIPQAKFVQTHRSRSLAAMTAIVAHINRYWGVNLVVIDSPYEPYLDRASDTRRPNGAGDWSDEVHRTFYTTSLVCPSCHAHTLPGDAFCPQCGIRQGLESAS